MLLFAQLSILGLVVYANRRKHEIRQNIGILQWMFLMGLRCKIFVRMGYSYLLYAQIVKNGKTVWGWDEGVSGEIRPNDIHQYSNGYSAG